MRKLLIVALLGLGSLAMAETQNLKEKELEIKKLELEIELKKLESTENQSKKKSDETAEKVIEKTVEAVSENKIVEKSDSKDAKSGFFIGVGAGSGLGYACSGLCEVDKQKTGGIAIASDVFAFDIKGGYQKYFNNNFGLRGYMSVNYGSGDSAVAGSGVSDLSQKLIMITANLDALAEKTFGKNGQHGIGVLAGIGLGSIGYKDNFYHYDDKKGFGAVINIGLFATIASKHKLEVTAKLLPLKDKAFSGEGRAESSDRMLAFFGYSYLF